MTNVIFCCRSFSIPETVMIIIIKARDKTEEAFYTANPKEKNLHYTQQCTYWIFYRKEFPVLFSKNDISMVPTLERNKKRL